MTAEERDEWERDEEALRREAVEGHTPAQNSTETTERAARVAAYAELIGRLYLTTSNGGVHSIEDIARGVVSVADSEVAARDAEIERLRGEVEEWRSSREFWRDTYVAADAKAAELGARAEAAEAKVAQVEALAADKGAWKGEKHVRITERRAGYEVIRSAVWVDDLRAALADAPAEQRAEGGA
jgi:hypothetical protein